MLLLLLFPINAYSQHPIAPTTIKGFVKDSINQERIPYTAIFLKGSDKGLLTGENGEFEMTTSVNFISLNVSVMGYKEKEVFVEKGKVNDLVIELVPTGVTLKEVVVNYKKDKYSKKNNPAVIFMEKLRARRNINDPKNHDYYSFDKHTKINLGLNDFSPEQKKNFLMKKFSFIFITNSSRIGGVNDIYDDVKLDDNLQGVILPGGMPGTTNLQADERVINVKNKNNVLKFIFF